MLVFADTLPDLSSISGSPVYKAVKVTSDTNMFDSGTNTIDAINTFSGTFKFSLGVFLLRFVRFLIPYCFFVICLWKIFKKAGRNGWESLIPIRNIFVLFKISGKGKIFRFFIRPFIIMLLIMILRLFMFIDTQGGYSFGYSILTLVYPISIILSIIFAIIVSIKLAKKFGKSAGFGLGLLFLSPIFFGILAFDKNLVYHK